MSDTTVRFGLRMHRDMRDMMVAQARRRRCSVRQLVERWAYQQELADQRRRLKKQAAKKQAAVEQSQELPVPEEPTGPRTPEQRAAVELSRQYYPGDETVQQMVGLPSEEGGDYANRWDFLDE